MKKDGIPHFDPGQGAGMSDAIPFLLTESERSKAASFAVAIEDHRRRCNARDTAIEEAQSRAELRRMGIKFEDGE